MAYLKVRRPAKQEAERLIAAIAEEKKLGIVQARSLAETAAEKLGFDARDFVARVFSLMPISNDDAVLAYLASLIGD